MLSRRRVLVTGGAGFLGSHLCERLVERGDDVLCADNLYTGSKDHVAHLFESPNFEFVRHDVNESLRVEVDEIYNLACPASPVHYQRDPVQTLRTSVHGAINMLGLAKRTGAKILQASTSEVYGDPEVHPQTEGYLGHVNTIGPRACYDEGKRAAETLFADTHRQYGTRIRIARIFNTYGPGMRPDDGRVVSNFVLQALRGEPLTIFGDGRQTRSFCYRDDLVDGLIRLMDVDDDAPGVERPVNLGNPGEVSMLDLAEKVRAITGSDVAIEFRPLPDDDPRRRCPSIDRATALLGWRPTTSLDEGLRRTVAYFARMLDASDLAASTMQATTVVGEAS